MRKVWDSPKARAYRSAEWKAKQAAKMTEFAHLGNASRKGVPRGWMPKEYHEYRAKCRDNARLTFRKLLPLMSEEQQKILKEDEMAQEAMVQTLTIMKDRTVKPETKLAAARTILEWTKQKPATKNEHTVRRAEDFLAALAAKEDDGPVIIEHTEEAPRRLPLLRAQRADDQNEEGND
jgi:hypothetical protein